MLFHWTHPNATKPVIVKLAFAVFFLKNGALKKSTLKPIQCQPPKQNTKHSQLALCESVKFSSRARLIPSVTWIVSPNGGHVTSLHPFSKVTFKKHPSLGHWEEPGE